MSHQYPDAPLTSAERAVIQLAARLRDEGLEPLLQLRLSDGDARVAQEALSLLSELDGDALVRLAFDAASRLSP